MCLHVLMAIFISVPDVSNITNWLIILVSLLSTICETKQGRVKILASIKFSVYHTFSCFIFFFSVPFSSRISQCSLKWLMSSAVWPVLECQHVIGLMLWQFVNDQQVMRCVKGIPCLIFLLVFELNWEFSFLASNSKFPLRTRDCSVFLSF